MSDAAISDSAVIERFLVEDLGLTEGGSSIGHDEDLLGGGVLDSAGISETVIFLEERFDIEIVDDELVPENFQTINAMAAFATRKKGGASPA